ncbi:hypothetical protein OJE16_22870 [Pantoea tagorei]
MFALTESRIQLLSQQGFLLRLLLFQPCDRGGKLADFAIKRIQAVAGFAQLTAGLRNDLFLALQLIEQLAARNFLRLNAFLFFGDILLDRFQLRFAVVGAVRGRRQ